ncbi:IS1 family transposase [Enterobacter sp. MGH 14]
MSLLSPFDVVIWMTEMAGRCNESRLKGKLHVISKPIYAAN